MFSVFPVMRRIGVASRRDSVRISELPVASLDSDLPAAEVLDDLFSSLLSLELSIENSARSHRAGLLYSPPCWIQHHISIVFLAPFGHLNLQSCSSSLVCPRVLSPLPYAKVLPRENFLPDLRLSGTSL